MNINDYRRIATAHKRVNIRIRAGVRKLLKSDNILLLVDDMKVHFKTKVAWPLDYHIYLSMSKLDGREFDQLLYMKKYKVITKDGVLVIIKRKK